MGGYAMRTAPVRVLSVIEALGSMDPKERITGMAFEDLGESLPEELEMWVRAVRGVMDDCGWHDARLLNHMHQTWDFMTAATIRCLIGGSDGVWASMCCEGAAIGQAASAVTIMNLVRFGNTKVLDSYNCTYLREAAINICKITTGHLPDPK